MSTRPKSRRLIPRCACDNKPISLTAETSPAQVPEQATIAPSHMGAIIGLSQPCSGRGQFGFTEYTKKR